MPPREGERPRVAEERSGPGSERCTANEGRDGDMYAGPVIDCDVHHEWESAEALYPYLEKGWREFVVAPTRAGLPPIPLVPGQMCPNPNGATGRPDAAASNGDPPGSNLERMQEQLLDHQGVSRVILDHESGQFIGSIPNPYFAAEVARAANEWSIERWLSGQDDRLYGAVLVATQEPDVAAEEIRRVGAHPRMCEVVLCASGLGKPFGHPAYHPIYEAAVEMDLPVAIHVGGEVAPLQGATVMASGMPSFYFESHTQMAQGMMTHLMSLIVHGVFEKYSDLRVVMVEATLAWVPWLLWSMDCGYKGLRRETPWLKRHPSEYFYRNVWMTTQPLDMAPSDDDLVDLLRMFNGQEKLCFASDYPHWDADDVQHVARRLPAAWHKSVFYGNAAKVFRWPSPAMQMDKGSSGVPAE